MPPIIVTITAYEDEHSGSCHVEDIFVPISHTNGHVLPDTPDDLDDDNDFTQFAPLVMHTIKDHTDITPASVISPHPQLSNSITTMDALPSFAQFPRPELIKPSTLTPTFTNRLPIHISNSIPPVSSSLVSSFANSICSINERVSPTTTPSALSNIDENSVCSMSSFAGNVLRGGAKSMDAESEENDENLDYESDFDDLEEILSELIKHKILPVADEDGEKFICPVCSVSLLNLHDLTVHIRSHNNPASGSQSNSCTICGKVLSSQSSLDRHMLVHSGERPFVCKICNMSFTTNGNMHRHSRIHTKEENLKSTGNQFQVRRGKLALRHHLNSLLKHSNSPINMKLFQGILPQDILKNLPNHSQQSVFVQATDVAEPVTGTKRHCNSTELSSDWQIPMKQQSFGSNETDINNVPRKYSYPIVPTKEREDLISEQSSEDKDVLHCPVCSKTFLCKYGVESHIETHTESSSHCNTCNLTFKNPRKLRLHRLIVHTEKPKSDKELEKGVKEDKNGVKKKSKLNIGFSDLTFVDFSVEKFPLIAKHYFEQNAHAPSSKYLNYTCKDCLKAFPCESSLILHMYTHTKEKCTQCPLCECDYADVNEFHAHMLKHLSDKAFEDIRPTANGEKGDDDLQPDQLTKHDFLAMFYLKEDEEKNEQKSVISSPKKELKPIKIEKHQNNNYFAKLGQTYAPGIVPVFGDLPYLQPGFQPTLDDFHTILQTATTMSMLPCMGLDPELLKNSPQIALTLPSTFISFPESIAKSLTSFPSTPKPAHTNSVPTYSGLNITPASFCESTAQVSGPEREISEIKIMNSGSFSCKYCNNSFTSYKTLKSHIHTHLGFSPYQCNFCIYSSADKSSLIQHVRTHSGARPYHCLLCDFAFTTRVNCERHIKNKHQLNDKDNIETVIYLNKCVLDAASSLDPFHSPDTICKYCGIDFKFFRALRNHLQSHGSDRQKPFQCKICYMGFCIKANCLRHVQQMHSDINDNQIENCVIVREYLGNDDNDSESAASDDGIPLYTEDGRASCLFETKSGTTQHFSAPSTPKPDNFLTCDSDYVLPDRQISPNYNLSPLSHIPHSQSELVIKTEPAETPAETPLDFSLKLNNESVRKDTIQYQVVSKLGNLLKMGSEETPIDLSVRRTVNHIPIAPKPPAVKFESSLLQCSQCPLGFSDNGALQRHISKCHPQLSNTETSMPSATHLVLYPIMKNDGRLLLQPRPSVSLSNNQFGLHTKRLIPHIPTTSLQQKSVSVTIQNLQEKLKQQKKELIARTPSAAEMDLASVTKMIDVTDPLNFKAFLHTDQSSEHRSPNTKLTTSNRPFSMTKLPNMIKRPGVQISLEHCIAINHELDNLQREGDVDEAALSQVREMALSVKEEVISNPITLAGQRTMSPVVMQSEGQNDDENSYSEDSWTFCVQKTEAEKAEIPVKKKRNSYADSPHKLACPYCPRAFPWVSSLTRHLLTHTGQKPFKCPRCLVTFSTKSNRERHLIRKHGVNMLDPLSRQTMDRPYKCPLCVFSSFSTQSNLLKHYHDRHNGANLPDSIAEIERMSPSAITAATMEMEVRAAENPPQADELSRNSMTNEEDDEDMENSIEDSSEKIDDDSNPDSEVEVQDDLQKLEGESEKSEKLIPMLISLLSDRSLITAEPERIKVAPHLLITMPKIKKNRSNHYLVKPDRKSDTDNELEHSLSPNTMKRNIEKIIAEQKAIIEQKTRMETVIQAEIKAQIEAQKKNENQSVSPVLTGTCQDLKFLDPTKPFTGSAEKIINPERDNYDVDKITECWKCNETFTSRKILVRHLKEHNIDLPYKCYLCDASYDSRMDCLTHQSDAHDSDWTILKNKNKVGNIEQFSIHMDKVVENNCTKLDSGSVLEIPGSGNDDSKMEVISADYMQRKVYCSLCPKRFWSLQDLRRHMRSHTGERPFECDVCQKRFTLKHSMMRHRKKHEGAPPPAFNDDDDDDSNGADDRALKVTSKSIQSKSSNQSQYAMGFNIATNSSISEPMPVSNSYLFTPGLRGGQMILGGSNIASLTPASVLSGCRSSINVTASSDTSKETVPTMDSVKKEFLDCSADMLHNLLGVESAAIEKMLDLADSKTAAKYLGITEVS